MLIVTLYYRSLLSGIHRKVSSKGTVDSGNASWIRVCRPESYRTVLTRTAQWKQAIWSHYKHALIRFYPHTLILLFSKNALNWQEICYKTFSTSSFFFFLFLNSLFIKESWKNVSWFIKNIKQYNMWQCDSDNEDWSIGINNILK